MNTEEICSKLLRFLLHKEFVKAQEELFHPDILSIEPEFHPNPITKGLTNLVQKEKQFLESIESWIQFEVSEPLISSNHFSIRMRSKLKMKNNRQLDIDEIIIYEVSKGKIIKEMFFYSPQ